MQAILITSFKWAGLGFFEPLIKLASGEEPKKNGRQVLLKIILPILSVFVFLGACDLGAKYLYNVERTRIIEKTRMERGDAAALEVQQCIDSGDINCKPNSLPSPADVWQNAKALWYDHVAIQTSKAEFRQRTSEINKQRAEAGLGRITYTGRPSFFNQIATSLKTVFAGFLMAALLAIPAGIILGLSPTLRSSFNWFIQILKPVSPVVWLLLVSMVVKTLLASSDANVSFIISFMSVGFCAMWATLVNTAMGVASVDKDYLNVAKVLRLGIFSKVFKIILPASIPMIFTGLRITLSVSWMVLIAIELLAQSPGLGSFVWEEFQNGSNNSNAKIIVAMFVIGIIGFLLDRIMMYIQKMVSFEAAS
jgi:nitrate/nitrite transport system permease protein